MQPLRAELRHAAGDHVLDLTGVESDALDHSPVGGAEQRGRMGVLVVALLQVSAPDGAQVLTGYGAPASLEARLAT